MSQDRDPAVHDFLVAWRTVELRDRQVVDGLVHPSHAAPSPPLAAALARWPGHYYWSDEPGGRHLVLTRARARPRERWWLHVALLLATLATATYAGAVLAGSVAPGPLLGLFHPFPDLGSDVWLSGLRFSLPLLAILLAHELGHYITARRYHLDTSPPYFVPIPLWSPIGTLGAFIRLRSIVSDRRQLLDVGAGGPLAGFALALPLLVWGMWRSAPLADATGLHGLVIWFGAQPAELGDSLITFAIRELFHPGVGAVGLDPLGFAGWMGMFVTMLNLFPISQLDGGHVLFAAAPRWHERAALLFWGVLFVMGWYGWDGWMLWAGVILVLSRGRLAHPPVLDAVRPVPRNRLIVAGATLILFVVTFMPVPIRL